MYGNHDALLVGTQPPTPYLAEIAAGGRKTTLLGGGVDVTEVLANTEVAPSPFDWGMVESPGRDVAADATRRIVGAGEWIAAHLGSPGAPSGHGFTPEDAKDGRAHYVFDVGLVRCVVLDTVNRAGGWQGSLDTAQFSWLEGELEKGHSRYYAPDGSRRETANQDRLFVLFGHHPIGTLINPWSPDGSRRVLRDEFVTLLSRFPNVVAYCNGHTHEHAVTAYPAVCPDGVLGGFFQITTASHIDWPQQARLIEVALDEETGDVCIFTAVLDHSGPVDPRGLALGDPLTLASWSRELSANAWQGRVSPEEPIGRGEALDRNCVCVVPAPFALGAVLAGSTLAATSPKPAT